MKTKHHIILFVIIFTFISCESTINVELPNDRLNSKDIFKDIMTTKNALSHIYSNVRDNFYLSKNTNGISHRLSLYTDELQYLGTLVDDFHLNAIQPNNGITTGWWNAAYSNIYKINLFIEGLSESTFIESDIKKQLLGEAYTLRALYYQNLTQLFGDVPYTTTSNFINNTKVNKTSSKQILKEIEKDLTYAISLLSINYRDPKRVYINKSVAELLLSENYLLQNNFELAEKFSRNVISNSIYKIEYDVTRTFKKNATSTIWQMSPDLDTNITPEASLYIQKTLTDNSTVISQNLLDSFDLNDLRRQNWIGQLHFNNQDFFRVYKYKNNISNSDEYSIFYRIEQAYFYLAESLIKQGKLSEATDIINIVKHRNNIQSLPYTLSSSQLLNELLVEINKEFFTEGGNRFYSLKRNNKLNEALQVKPNWKEYHQVFPIPERQLLINKNLQPQNAGY